MEGWGQSIYLKSEEAFFRRRRIEHWQVKTEDEEEEKRVDFLNKHERRRGRKRDREDMASISSALRFVFLNSAAKIAERENRSENEGEGI